MKIIKMQTNGYVQIPGLCPTGKDIFINFEATVTNLGVVVAVDKDTEALIPWAKIQYITRATQKEKEAK